MRHGLAEREAFSAPSESQAERHLRTCAGHGEQVAGRLAPGGLQVFAGRPLQVEHPVASVDQGARPRRSTPMTAGHHIADLGRHRQDSRHIPETRRKPDVQPSTPTGFESHLLRQRVAPNLMLEQGRKQPYFIRLKAASQ